MMRLSAAWMASVCFMSLSREVSLCATNQRLCHDNCKTSCIICDRAHTVAADSLGGSHAIGANRGRGRSRAPGARAPRAGYAAADSARLVGAHPRHQPGPGAGGVRRHADLGSLAARTRVVARGAVRRGSGRRARLPGDHLRFLLVASRASRGAVAVALVAPGTSQRGADRGGDQLLQTSGRDAAQQPAVGLHPPRLPRTESDLCLAGGHDHRPRRARLSQQPEYALVAGLPVPASGKPSPASRDRPSPRQFFRPAAVGHPVRNLRQPAPQSARMRVRPRARTTTAAHAARETPAMRMRDRLAWAFLVTLGTLQIGAEAFGMARVKALAAALQLSPSMKVFTAHQGYETHAARFSLSWMDDS